MRLSKEREELFRRNQECPCCFFDVESESHPRFQMSEFLEEIDALREEIKELQDEQKIAISRSMPG